ncbi:hypothetical protein HDA40_000792 [Hamadaea flava]|uniref:Insulinase family protein n=1 Tax=Hamadaea flava TaxID=1742688 RepID=A0ABV8LRT1_9ACTN|nr:insulinase family protein [Hamadaea flava]MCP2322285.1 hypothetical protein [Hamadaea flava]
MLEVDGVPVLLAPTPGPMRAGLVFRVGRADETLATAGVTHLVEHLALHRLGVTDFHYNGMTGTTATQFVTQGTSESVARFLTGVCANLRDLPLDRLATEKNLIRTEAAGRPDGVNEHMPLWRHGARDYGLVSFPEWGMHTLTAEQVTASVRERFTRQNAVLWIAGAQIPDGLRLDLRDGRRWELPEPSSALPVTPAVFNGVPDRIVMEAPVPRTRAGAAYARLLERALFRELRQERGLSYTAAAAYHTDGRPQALVTAVADVQTGRGDATVEVFLAQVSALATNVVDDAELETVRALELDGLRDPEVEGRLLARRSVDLLTGFAWPSTAEMVETFEKLTAADIVEVAAAASQAALLMLPAGTRRTPPGFEQAPTFSRFAVDGTRYRSRVDRDVVLVLGSDGASVVTADGPATVLYDDSAVLLRWPDGGRRLIGGDGITVAIEPAYYPVGDDALAGLDAAVGPAKYVDLPERDTPVVPAASRIGAWRIRLRRFTLPWRARLDRFATLRGGRKNVLITTAMGVVAVGLILAATLGARGLACPAVIWTGTFIWRWNRTMRR